MRSLTATEFPDLVLVVDDEPVVVEVLSRILPLRGLQVIAARSGEEAAEQLRTTGIGCLLADKNLPGMNGIELIALTRKMQPHCACIVMTAYASTVSAVEALRLGAVDYLEKPFQDVELVAQKVRLAIDHYRAGFERDRLVRLLQVFQLELTAKEKLAQKQLSELQLFNEILELRVEQATRDLSWKCEELERRLARGASPREGEIVGVEMALMILEELQANPDAQHAAVRGQLQRVVRQLTDHLQALHRDGKAP